MTLPEAVAAFDAWSRVNGADSKTEADADETEAQVSALRESLRRNRAKR